MKTFQKQSSHTIRHLPSLSLETSTHRASRHLETVAAMGGEALVRREKMNLVHPTTTLEEAMTRESLRTEGPKKGPGRTWAFGYVWVQASVVFCVGVL